MKKVKAIISTFILIAAAFNTNAQWVTQNSGTTNILYSVFFTNNNVGYVVGASGTILNTTDGGSNWNSQTSGVTGYLHGITFTDVNTGYAVGQSGVILKTIDGGVNWNALTSGTTTNLLDVHFADVNNGYAVGWNGRVLKTTDAGVTWVTSGSGINTLVNLTSVFFTTANNGYVTGLSGYFYETTDGGASWIARTSPGLGSLNLFSVQFVSPSTGFIVGENNAFIKTIDGGTNWSSNFGGGTVLSGVYFTDANTGYAVGNNSGTGAIQETTNGGTTWSVTLSGGASQNDVYFPASNTGYSVGYNGEIHKLAIPSTGIDTRTECNSLTWIDGNIYTSNNNTATYNIVGGAVNGGDSLVTLNLTVINSTTSTDIQTACSSFAWIDGNIYSSNNNTATHILTNAAGCDSIITLNLTITPSYSLTESANVCSGSSYTFPDGTIQANISSQVVYTSNLQTINSCDSIIVTTINVVSIDTSVIQSGNILTTNVNSANYQWLDCNNGNALINGETSAIFTAVADGNYSVEITQNGCVDTSSCYLVTGVGITNENLPASISVYPSPTSGNVTIQLGGDYQGVNISIIGITGKIVFHSYYDVLNQIDIKIKGETGLYFVEVVYGSKKSVFKVIKV